MALIEADRLVKVHGSGTDALRVLDGVSLSVEAGETLSIVGPSGSGKSTLMHLLGLLDRPTSGVVRFNATDTAGLSGDDRARIRNRRIGFVFQAYNLLPRHNAIENIELPLVYSGMPAKERRRRANEALAAVGLDARGRHWPSEMSGGEQQRVAIARAMVTRPSIILADEPTGALDSKNRDDVLDVLLRLREERVAIVIVTHDDAVASRCARTIELIGGRAAEAACTALDGSEFGEIEPRPVKAA